MIGRLKGIVEQIDKDFIILDVNGVGYIVFCSLETISSYANIGDQIILLIETIVREDSIALYGFKTMVERDWFRKLTTVKGVGPKLSQIILGSLNADTITHAILSQDRSIFNKVTGVGPKLAERIIHELKDKVSLTIADNKNPQNIGSNNNQANYNEIMQDAISALINLGYGRSDVLKVVTQLIQNDDNINISELIKQSLKELAGRVKNE